MSLQRTLNKSIVASKSKPKLKKNDDIQILSSDGAVLNSVKQNTKPIVEQSDIQILSSEELSTSFKKPAKKPAKKPIKKSMVKKPSVKSGGSMEEKSIIKPPRKADEEIELEYYNNQLDNIIVEILNDETEFPEEKLSTIVITIVDKFYQRDTSLTKTKLKKVIESLIDKKFTKYYSYTGGNVDNENFLSDKVTISSAKDLISHRYDYPDTTFKTKTLLRRKNRVEEIKLIPQHEQKSQEWLNQRQQCLTATAISGALDEDPYSRPINLLIDKVGRGKPFKENKNVHHGKKYEEIGSMYYSFRNNVNVAEYGLLQDEKYTFIGASPDGICEKNTPDNKLSSLVGRLLEIKFPTTRKIILEGDLDGDIIPHYYNWQILTQLYVTKLDECDFLQCKIDEYDSWDEFVADSRKGIPGLSTETNLEKGCLIQLLPKNMIGMEPGAKIQDIPAEEMCLYNAKYIYPPKLHMTFEDIKNWIAEELTDFHKNKLSKEYMIDRVIYWRLSQIACHTVKSDTARFEAVIPTLKQFWDYVLFYREHPEKMDQLLELVEDIGEKQTAAIFKRVNQDYLKVNKKSNYQPLYQEINKWRQKYNEKEARYSKYVKK